MKIVSLFCGIVIFLLAIFYSFYLSVEFWELSTLKMWIEHPLQMTAWVVSALIGIILIHLGWEN